MTSRTYTQGARAEAVDARRHAVLDALQSLFVELPYDEITLVSIAERSGVSLKTVTRQFGTKEAIVTAFSKRRAGAEQNRRAVPVGDIAGVVQILSERYTEMSEMAARRIALEDSVPVIREAANRIRRMHLDWLAEAFAPWLPPESNPIRRERLAALFTATEIYAWWSLRQLGFTTSEVSAAMLDTLSSLVQSWQTRSTP